MKRLNQTEPATFSILPCWDFFRNSIFEFNYIFLYFEVMPLVLKVGLQAVHTMYIVM
jgi:hypothetical protein